MFSLYLRNRNGLRVLVSVLAVTFCLLTAFTVVGCKTDDDAWEDDHILNPDLIGMWIAPDQGWGIDTYTITATTISHPEAFTGPYADAEIVYVYNFNEAKTAGGLIIKRAENSFQGKPFLAVWFKELRPQDKVLLGDAYDTRIQYPADNDPSVATLDEAKQRFTPANAAIYGGGSAQEGSPQAWQ